jgi:hypothetical protein
LGDYQCRPDPAAKGKAYAYRFWDIEQPRFRLMKAPNWLAVDEDTGLVSGRPQPDDLGSAHVVLEVADRFEGRSRTEYLLKVQVVGGR